MRIDNKILDDRVKNEKILLAFKKRFNIGLESVPAGFAAKLLYTALYILHYIYCIVIGFLVQIVGLNQYSLLLLKISTLNMDDDEENVVSPQLEISTR